MLKNLLKSIIISFTILCTSYSCTLDSNSFKNENLNVSDTNIISNNDTIKVIKNGIYLLDSNYNRVKIKPIDNFPNPFGPSKNNFQIFFIAHSDLKIEIFEFKYKKYKNLIKTFYFKSLVPGTYSFNQDDLFKNLEMNDKDYHAEFSIVKKFNYVR